jgi:hypothetical protein
VIVLICGGREWNNALAVEREIDAVLQQLSKVIHGKARGADSIGGAIARNRGIPVQEHPALWNVHGRSAGPIRNREMMSALLADPDPDKEIWAFHEDLRLSKGTKDMVRVGKKHRELVTVRVYSVETARLEPVRT